MSPSDLLLNVNNSSLDLLNAAIASHHQLNKNNAIEGSLSDTQDAQGKLVLVILLSLFIIKMKYLHLISTWKESS
jgi:hypothetical protein